MCRKCEEMSCFGSLGHVENLSFGLVLSDKDARLNLKTYLMAQSDQKAYYSVYTDTREDTTAI